MIDLRCGDCREVLNTLPDQCAQCIVTSPPYYGLRDYGVDGQIGLEETPDAYVAELVAVFRAAWRVLRDDGTLWLNLGDSYASGGNGTSTRYQEMRGVNTALAQALPRKVAPVGLKPKDLIGIPWRVAFALQADGWYFRQDIIWHKPNPMPESVTDRCTKAHEYMFLLTKRERYYFDAAAIAEPSIHAGDVVINSGGKNANMGDFGQTRTGFIGAVTVKDTRNRRSVWTIPTHGFSEAHFATFPEALVEPCILAGTRPGDTVLDMFCGSGTTGAVSRMHGRDFVGIELNHEYLDMARRRIFSAGDPRVPLAPMKDDTPITTGLFEEVTP